MSPTWPDPPRPEAFHGVAGEIVRTIEPHSEADPAALLVQQLVSFGNAAGRGAGFEVEGDQHSTGEYVAIVGATAKARKGSSWGHVRRVMQLADPGWVERCIGSGIASGEGLIHAVRDPLIVQRKARTAEEKKRADADGRIEEEVDPGVSEKRLLIAQGELAQVLRVMRRDGNTVSPIMRDLWDHGSARGMTKNDPERTTGALVSAIGHVTVRELRRELTETETANGFANRWLWVCARRSKSLPRGGRVDEVSLTRLGKRLAEGLEFAGSQGMLDLDEPSWGVWEAVYPDLSDGRDDLLGAVTARGEAHVRRLAVIYALLDLSAVVRVEHLRAALAVWDYCAASAAYIFGGTVGDPLADKILVALRDAGEGGLTRSDIRAVVGGHVPADEIDQALAFLAGRGLAHDRLVATDGRPAHRWHVGAVGKADSSEESRPAGTLLREKGLSSGSDKPPAVGNDKPPSASSLGLEEVDPSDTSRDEEIYDYSTAGDD